MDNQKNNIAMLHVWMTERLLQLRDMPEADRYAAFRRYALTAPSAERFVFFS